MLKNGPVTEEKQLNGENKGPNRNEDVLIKVYFKWLSFCIYCEYVIII